MNSIDTNSPNRSTSTSCHFTLKNRIKKKRTESYNLVQFEPSDVSISRSTYSSIKEWVNVDWNLSLRWCAVCSPYMAKHGSVESFCINSTNAIQVVVFPHQQNKQNQKNGDDMRERENSLMIRSQCFLAALNPSLNNLLNSRNEVPVGPPNTSIYSGGNLKGAASNPILPGVLLNINPKSIWIRCPSLSKRMLPLCLSLIWSKNVTME